MTPAGLLGTTYPMQIGTREEQIAEQLLASALLILGAANRRGVPHDDAVDGTITWLSRKCTEAEFKNERFEALMFMVENVAKCWTWRERHDCEEDGFDDETMGCPQCQAETSRLNAERLARIQPPPDDGSTDCPF